MIVMNSEQINLIDGIIGSSDNYIKKINNCYLTEREIELLKKYGINFKKCNNNKELLLLIENYIQGTDNSELEWLSSTLAERGYYLDTNK